MAKDEDLFEKGVHWPTVYAAVKASGEEVPDTLDEFRNAELSLRLGDGGHREAVEGLIAGALPEIKTEELAGGTTRVTFPEVFPKFVFEARSIDGQWLVVKYPRS